MLFKTSVQADREALPGSPFERDAMIASTTGCRRLAEMQLARFAETWMWRETAKCEFLLDPCSPRNPQLHDYFTRLI